MADEAHVTAVVGLVEQEPGAGVRATALVSFVEVDPGAGVRVTAFLGLLEIDVPLEVPEPPVEPSPPPVYEPLPELYDVDGRRLGHLSGFEVNRAFLLNDVGTGELTVARDETMVSELTRDRFVLILSRYGLPSWLGTIVQIERTFEMIRCQLREATVLLARWNGFGLPIGMHAEGVPDEEMDTDTPAALIAQALTRINTRNATRLRLGTVEVSGTAVSLTHTRDKSVLDELRELAEVFEFDFWTEPKLDAGRRLIIRLHAASRRQRDRRSQVRLWEGHSLGRGSRRKLFSTAFGSQASALCELEVTDTGLWAYLEPGDLIGVRSDTLRLTHDARVLGMEPDERQGRLTMVAELV